MIRTKRAPNLTSERKALMRRIKAMYDAFNGSLWEKCFAMIDPKLRDQSKVQLRAYLEQMRAFQEAYGRIRFWETRISLHLDGSSNKHDPRPFAYVYVVWQDDSHGFHMFKERWVKHQGKWYTRVAGLVPNKHQVA